MLGLRMVEEDARSPLRLLQTPLATTKWNVVVTGIAFTGTTSSKTHFFSAIQSAALVPRKKLLHSSPEPACDLPIIFFPN